MKPCNVCGETKPLGDFYELATMRDGHRNDCKSCNLAAKARRYRKNSEAEIARVRRWQAENAERVNEYRRRYNATRDRKDANRRSYLKRKYGVTPEWYDATLAAQGGGCAICGRPPRPDISLHVDHDHATGALRRLLCFGCNNLLGDARDDAALLAKASAYLDAHDPETVELRQQAKRRAHALAG
jgi:hypothetical protein